MYDIRSESISKEFVLKTFEKEGFDRSVLDAIVDIDHIKVKENLRKGGYHITIVQKTVESSDIIEYFADTFRKKYSHKNIRNKFVFEVYTKHSHSTSNRRGYSSITFFYRYNLFEKSKSKEITLKKVWIKCGKTRNYG